jgi:hypothetical protein
LRACRNVWSASKRAPAPITGPERSAHWGTQ